MQKKFTVIKMTESLSTPMTKMRHVQMQNVVLEENKEFKYTLFSMFPLRKIHPILTDFLSEYYSD